MAGKMFKRIVSVVLAAATVLSLCACGDSAALKNAEANKLASKQYVYAYEDIDFGVDWNNANLYGMEYIDGRLYALLQDYSGNFNSSVGARTAAEEVAVDMPAVMPEEEFVYSGPVYILASAKIDGTDQKQVLLDMADMAENAYMSRITIVGDGSVIGVQESYTEDLTDPANPIYKTINYMCRWDAEGKLCWKKDMTEFIGEVEYYYPRDMFTTEDGSLMFYSYEGIGAVVDMDGNLIEPVEMSTDTMDSMGNIYKGRNGVVYMLTYDYSGEHGKMYVSTFDAKTGEMGEKIELPGNLSSYNFYSGYNTDFTLTSNTGVYTYNVGDEAPVQIMDFINSDFPTSWLNNVMVIDDNHMIASYSDQTEYKTHLAYFTKVNPEDVPDKNTLMLGCVYLDYNVRKRIIDFNKSNPEYRIMVKDYSKFNTMDDYMAGYTQLNNDIISNQMPDILLVNSSMDINNYISKGVLTDLNELIANDEELANVEILPNIVEAFSVDGKMYTLVSSFSVNSMVAKTSLLEGRTSWTMAEFVEFANNLPEGSSMFGDQLMRDTFLYQVMTYLGSDFVDPMTGKCSFNSQEFMDVLEFAKTMPKELPENYYEDYDWTQYETMYRENRTIMMEVYMSSIGDLKYQIKGQIGEPVTFIGFPSPDGDGSVLYSGSASFAISAKSAFKDGAWDFVRYYLTDEYQKSDEFYEFPVVKSAFLEKAKQATEKPYWTDQDGNKVEYDDTYYIGGEEIILEPFTQEEVDEICEFIYTVNKTSKFDQELRNIITEEAESFFEGQKSAQEVATIIQSRAQVYIDENR